MSKYYNSEFYSKPIEVANIEWEILVIITDDKDRNIIYSWYDIEEKNTNSFYINKCLLGWIIKKIPENVLIIWFWWWSFAKYIEDHMKNVKITWIDIDKTMFEIAKKELFVKTNDFLVIDAFEGIKNLASKWEKYDLILIDIYWNNWEIPDYLQDIIFFEKIKNILSDDGIVSINFADYEIWNEKYEKIHNNLINIFGKNFSHILEWINNRWNIAWIYNLDKKYSQDDFINKYSEYVWKWKISFDENMIKNVFID